MARVSPAELLVPVAVCGIVILALCRGTDVFSALTDGALDGLKTAVRILPPLVILLTAVSMLRVGCASRSGP